jgi:hypothetical protein
MTNTEADEARAFFVNYRSFITAGTVAWEEPGNIRMLYRLAELGLLTVQRVMYANIGQFKSYHPKFGVKAELTSAGKAYSRMLGSEV